METWDLTSGAAKLNHAVQTLQRARADAAEHWHDETYQKFQERYLDPLEPKIQETLDAIHRLMQVLSRASNECNSYDA